MISISKDSNNRNPIGRAILAVAVLGLGLVLASSFASAQVVCLDAITNTTAGATASGAQATACGGNAVANGNQATATGFTAQATGSFSTATGRTSNASGTSSTATGQNATASGSSSTATGQASFASGNLSTATGRNAIASGQSSTATGASAFASALNATATGAGAGANAVSSTANGQLSLANHSNSAAWGANTVTTRANQQVFGTTTNTYTMTGIASGASQAAQGAPTHIVTTNANGDLAAHTAADLGLASQSGLSSALGKIDENAKAINENTEGIAIAMAMSGLSLANDKTFALSANLGFYDGKQAIAVQSAMRLDNTFILNGGIGTGFNGSGKVGGRVGVSAAW